MKNTLLEIRNVCGGYDKDINILQDLSLAISKGEALGVIGLNGSGKSTLGKALMNLLPYRSGDIIFDEVKVNDKSTYEISQSGITMMHQGGTVFPDLSVWDNLRLAYNKQNNSLYKEKLESLIPLLTKPKRQLMRMMADKLSGGERHQLALAMVLARNPKLIILDEPSAGLSPAAVENMFQLLAEIRKTFGTTIILIEQNIAHAVAFCDRLIMLENGNLHTGLDNLDIKEIETILFKNKQ